MATIHSNAQDRRHVTDRRSNRTSATKNRMTAIDWIAMAFVIIGGLNWGLIGLFSFDLVAAILGPMSALSRVVYTLVGLSALYTIYTCSKMSGKKT